MTMSCKEKLFIVRTCSLIHVFFGGKKAFLVSCHRSGPFLGFSVEVY